MKFRVIGSLTIVLALFGCAPSPAPAPKLPTEPASASTEIAAASIQTAEDGIEWARALDSSVTAAELSKGIQAIGDLVPDEDIWFASNNEIGGELISLNADVLADPEGADTKVDDLNAIVDDLEAAIKHGDRP